MDGSPPAFYYYPGNGDGATKWFLHYEGGAFCTSIENCYTRSKTDLGSSNNYNESVNIGGDYFSTNPKLNPLMYNWNKVLFKYCDGSFYMGENSTITYYNGSALYFRGFRNVVAMYNKLVSGFNLNKGTDFVISGCSAGGVATFFLVDLWKSRLPAGSKVRGLPDSGFFIDYQGNEKSRMVSAALRWIFKYSNGTKNLKSDCRAAHPTDPEICGFSHVIAPYVSTPLFPLQSQFDEWQVHTLLNTLDPSIVNPYGAIIKNDFMSAVLSKPENGCFLDSCYHHCGKWDSINIDNTLSGDAFYNWYTKGVGTYIQDKPFPCDACCFP
uniref:Pectin acetylesterase n=1 Tax=Arcella intermedia TaxID=1963864 RepID=A0A6B2L9L2_9EUKA